MNTVNKVIEIAEKECGYLEKSAKAYKSNHDVLYEKIKGAGLDNYTKYGKEMHEIYPSVMDFPAAWCDAFVDWCFYKAYGVANAKGLLGGNFNDYTIASAQLYKNKKSYYTTNPKVGDQIFFNNGKNICHTGLVYKVDNVYVYTIEGNTSGASGVVRNGGGVCKKKYLKTYSKIDGYGRPAYDKNVKKTFSGTFPTLPSKGYLAKGDKGTAVRRLQEFLSWYGYAIERDGEFGEETEKYVKQFQKAQGLTVDGQFGKKSLAKAKNVKK